MQQNYKELLQKYDENECKGLVDEYKAFCVKHEQLMTQRDKQWEQNVGNLHKEIELLKYHTNILPNFIDIYRF